MLESNGGNETTQVVFIIRYPYTYSVRVFYFLKVKMRGGVVVGSREDN
jgi:hypothetical protein